jgi:uncharacterized protein (TIGR03382 family)
LIPPWFATLILLATFALTGAARAQTCPRPDLLDALPPDGAEQVPTNAHLVARYATNAEYLGESILFGVLGEEPFALVGAFNAADGLVEVIPPGPLRPFTDYGIEWPALRGLGTASLGTGRFVSFRTSDAEDEAPPRFEGVSEVRWSVDRFRDPCTKRREERFAFELELAPVTDDAGRDLLTLVVFQTRGPTIDADAPPLPVLTRAYPESDRVRLRLAVPDATGRVCFAAIARDLAGRISSSASREVCAQTVAPPFFQGCSASGRPPGSAPWLWLSALLGIMVRRRRSSPVHIHLP